MKVITLVLVLAALTPAAAWAQTPEQLRQMEYERQQREYWRAQEQQRQEQQRQQQVMQDNARRQQDEMRRATQSNLPQSQGSPMAPAAGGHATAGGSAAQLEQARQAWLKRPALAAERNPLLGVWTRPGSAASRSSDPFAQLGEMMKGGLCGVLFNSDGMFEFKPAALVGIDKRTRRAEPLDQVEYRGDAKRVAVIPKTTLKLMVFDIEGPDRVQWAGQNCTLVRVGGAAQAARR